MGCEVTQCCCGCSLKTGSTWIGIVEAVLCGLAVIGLAVAAGTFGDLEDQANNDPDLTEKAIEDFRAGMSALIIISIVMAVSMVVEMIFAILLAYGASHDKPALIRPWIIYSIVALVLGDIVNIVLASYVISNGGASNGLQMLATCALGTAVKVYFIIVVRSYHLELIRPGAKKTFA